MKTFFLYYCKQSGYSDDFLFSCNLGNCRMFTEEMTSLFTA